MKAEQLQELKELLNADISLISDNHFGHPKVFEEYEPIRKQYTIANKKSSLTDFEILMIRNWNLKIPNTGTVLHLGDFCINKMKEGQTELNIKNNSAKLNGKKVLVKGNHDTADNSVYFDNGWSFVIDKPTILLGEPFQIKDSPKLAHCIITEINGKRIMFSHFGVFQYDQRFEGKYKEAFECLQKLYKEYNCDLNLHGHSHSEGINSKTSFNCSVEAINFTPKTFKEISMSLFLNFKD
jgi:calcineurin-like phosphoesterase family protein